MVEVDMSLRMIVNWSYTFMVHVCVANVGAFEQF